MDRNPQITTPEKVQQKSAYRRPAWAGVDQDPARRPGVPRMRLDPRPLPNTRFPPERQAGEPAAPMHGRPNKRMPPVFGTSTPLAGLSGPGRRPADWWAARRP